MKKFIINIALVLLASAFNFAQAMPVNINTANAKIISDSLTGIGLVKAQAIVDYRQKNGAFESVESLTQVKGIGSKTLQKIKEDIKL